MPPGNVAGKGTEPITILFVASKTVTERVWLSATIPIICAVVGVEAPMPSIKIVATMKLLAGLISSLPDVFCRVNFIDDGLLGIYNSANFRDSSIAILFIKTRFTTKPGTMSRYR
jgi:hypothetical protein